MERTDRRQLATKCPRVDTGRGDKYQNGLRRKRDEGRSNRRADFVIIILPRPPASQ